MSQTQASTQQGRNYLPLFSSPGPTDFNPQVSRACAAKPAFIPPCHQLKWGTAGTRKAAKHFKHEHVSGVNN